MALRSILTGALEFLSSEFDKPPVFVWRGVDVQCVPTSESRGNTLEIGGFVELVTLSLYVDRSAFIASDPTLVVVDDEIFTAEASQVVPVAGKKLTFKGRPYRILTARESAVGSHILLNLGDPNR
jgi:hypothetical protein